VSLLKFFLGIPGLDDKTPDPVGTIKKMHTVFFKDVETERGKDATEEVAKKYKKTLDEMTAKFEKIIENKEEDMIEKSEEYINELEKSEEKARNLEESLECKIRKNATSNNSNNSIFQPQSIMGPNPDMNIDIFEIFLDAAYKRKIKKGEEAYRKKYKEMEALYKEKIYNLNEKFERKKQTLDTNFKELADIIQETLNEMAIVKEKIIKFEGALYE